MISHLEITNRCVSCDICRLICPEDAILKNKQDYTIDTWSCTLCGICTEICPVDSIKPVQSNEQN